MLMAAFPLAYLVKTELLPADLTSLYAPEVYVAPAALVAIPTLFLLQRRAAHRLNDLRSFDALAGWVLLSVGMALGFATSVLFVFKLAYVSRLFVALYGATSVVLLVLVRIGFRPLLAYARASADGATRVLLVGTEEEAADLARALDEEAAFGIKVVGRLSVEELHRAAEGVSEEASPSDPTLPALDALLAHEAIDEVAVATTKLQPADLARLVAACNREGVTLHVSMAALGAGLERATLERVAGETLLSVNPQVHSAWARAVKRALDYLFAPILLVLLAPIGLLIAIAIKLDSTGPVLFRQERVGLSKRRFWMLKFRTMHEGADALRPLMSDLNEADGPIFKLRQDPRVTRVGRFLRRFDFDELPQIVNVLLGHMTLIGPRPMLPSEIVDFASWQRKRFSMLPGMTGLWQVSARLGDPYLAGLQADLDYIDRWSLRLDLEILLRTIPAMLRDRGAR